jgi:hypothetical protein
MAVLVIAALATLSVSVGAYASTQHGSRDPVTTGKVPVQVARHPGRGGEREATASSHPLIAAMRGAPNPCRLVSLAQARRLSHGAIVRSTEVPLGPTCIFRLAHSRREYTLTIETLKFAQVTGLMKQRQRMSIHHALAYCGRLGQPMLFARLSQGRVLNVTAPCTIAKQFASLALPRLG